MTGRRRALATAVLSALALGGIADGATARTYKIRAGGDRVNRIGPYKTRITRHYSPTIGKAERAFGRASVRFERHGGCIVKWGRLGLRMEFWDYGGGMHGEGCRGDVGYAQSFSVTGRKVRSWHGVRVGMTKDQVLRRHPAADWRLAYGGNPKGYWLRTAVSPFADNDEYPVVGAAVHGGRVTKLYGWIGSAGE